jgi:hypothetical protein
MIRARGLGLVIAAAIGCWGALVEAGGPFDKLLVTRRVEADPAKDYRVTDKNGPWMISACSFSGEEAEKQAKELTLELRKRYKLPAYVYVRRFALEKETFGAGLDRYGNPQKMQYKRARDFGSSEIQEVAVLVGDYRTIDDPEAQETLHKLKYYDPEVLKPGPEKKTSRTLAALRWIQRDLLTSDNEKKKRGPMNHAFMTTNPLLPKDFFSPKGLDDLVIKANDGVKHCLLDCPGKYTVQVATFTGKVIIKPSEIAEIETGKKHMDSELADAAWKAHRLTEALREKGYEAYEFHDRYASIVTVGSFDWSDQPGPNGQKQLNPAIQKLITRFQAEPSKSAGGQVEAQSLLGIPFDPQPIPVHVPRRSIGATYAADAVK